MRTRKTIITLAKVLALASLGLASCANSTLPEGLWAVVSTGKGDITIKLAYDKSPLTVGNFVGLAEGKLGPNKGKPFYDGLTFHRVEAGFVVQGGDPKGTGEGGPGYTFPDEIAPDLKFDTEGVLGMANAGPDTNGCQFFITLKATPFLDGNYPVFGRVDKGLDVVRKLAVGDKMTKVRIVRSGAAAAAFKSDQASFDARKATVLSASAEKADESRVAAIAAVNARWPDLAREANGMFKKILKAGSGAKPVAGDNVSVNYKGMLVDGTVFDESAKHGGAFKVKAGAGQVIPGWDQTLLDMTRGEKRIVVIPPELAYGAQGAGGVIPPNAFIAFEMELVDISK